MGHVLTNGAATLTETGAERSASLLGALDPRARILAALTYGITVVALDTLPALTLALTLSLTLLALSGLPAGRTLKRVAMVDGFILFMLALLPFTVPGDPMFTLFGYPASWQGLARAIDIGLTANAVVLALMVLVGTLEPVTLGHALHRLRVPETLVHLMMFTVRYIEVLREEYLRLRAAMKVRGFRPGTNWHSYRSFGYLVGMMMVRAIERSERLLGAMKCRGFSGRIVLLQEFRTTRADTLFALVVLACLIALAAVDLTWR
ncbi:cobalt ECF transporter T component CbiQ [Maliponia aquimaris]|uniref:Nickel transport protein NikQ n=1 Tax=Maliponia aquimaris TaxID=1673631 RepID=A0A238K1Q8_9RHOB|nr:cobalt ECF transporter T component CbiQ [Maliponia aquimaris]SMX36851.1 Nickel transport protein NikQ [Maliponia aquimaris]